jgi:hypothetical protein
MVCFVALRHFASSNRIVNIFTREFTMEHESMKMYISKSLYKFSSWCVSGRMQINNGTWQQEGGSTKDERELFLGRIGLRPSGGAQIKLGPSEQNYTASRKNKKIIKLVQLDYTFTNFLYTLKGVMEFIACNLEIYDVLWVPINAWQ